MANKLDTAMWISRLFTVYCSALFVLPLLGYVLQYCKIALKIYKVTTLPFHGVVFHVRVDFYCSAYLDAFCQNRFLDWFKTLLGVFGKCIEQL